MKIFFTGASSFTGMWFIKELVQAGHEVTATFSQPLKSYSGLRGERVLQILDRCQALFSCSFGTESCLKAIRSKPRWDLFCHHAADVTNYKSPNFDVDRAVANNTYRLKDALEASERPFFHT